jgi:hypothetical protein
MDSIGSLPDVQGLCCRESKYRVPFSVQHSNTKESKNSLSKFSRIANRFEGRGRVGKLDPAHARQDPATHLLILSFVLCSTTSTRWYPIG